MKKTKKFIIILFISITILLLLSTIVRADIGINTEDYKTTVTTTENGEGLKVVGTILGIVRNLGVIASVLAISIIGLKYMLGSLEEKANYKENMILYITGCFLLVACTTLPNVIYNLATDGNGGTTTEGMVVVTFEYGTNSTTKEGYPREPLEPPNLSSEEFSYWIKDARSGGAGMIYNPVAGPYKFPDEDVVYTAVFADSDGDGRPYILATDNNAKIWIGE